ncbi:hypothetical protein Tco_0934796 [Tanacetum coccineum]
MLESEAYKTYHDYATGEKIPKPKYVKNKADLESSPKKKSAPSSEGKRLKTSAKVTKPDKKKQPTTTSKAKGLNVLSKVALSKAEQMKLAIKRSKIQFHSSHASGSGADKGTDDADNEDDDDQDDADNKDDDDQDDADNKDDDGQEDDDEQTDLDNDGDDFVHPKFSTHDQEERQDEEDKEEEASDLKVQTPSHYESTDDEESDEVTQEGRDTDMTDAPQTNVQGTQVTEDTHVIMSTATPKVQQQSSSVSSGFMSNMLNQNPDTVSSIPGIVDMYLANKMNEAVKKAIQLQSDRLRDEAQAENADFINKLDDNIKKIIKEQVKVQVKDRVSKILPKIKKLVNDQLEVEVRTRSSNEAKTSHARAANLSELELKKILIDKMEMKNSYLTYQDEDEEPSTGSTGGPREEELEKNLNQHSAQAEEPIHADEDLEEPAHQEFDTGFIKDQPIDETTQHHDWFQKPTKPPTPDRDWNKTLSAVHGPLQPWISNLAQKEDTRDSFNELMDTPLVTPPFLHIAAEANLGYYFKVQQS